MDDICLMKEKRLNFNVATGEFGIVMNPFKGLCIIMLYSLSCIEGEIRCHCNESGCVTTGYMCKSQLGMCYSLVKHKEDTIDPGQTIVVSGCADTLQREPRLRTCAEQELLNNDIYESDNDTNTNEAVKMSDITAVESAKGLDDAKHSDVDSTERVLMCCTLDMCNYRDSYGLSIILDANSNDLSGKGNEEDVDDNSPRKTHGELKPHKDLWFKAAVIAVPIAGGFILILLVLLAVRMLRTDSRHRKSILQIRRKRRLTKAQLYITDHLTDKDKYSVNCDSHSANHSPVHSHNVNQIPVISQSLLGGREHSCCPNHSHHRNCNCHHHRHKHNIPKQTTNKDGYTYEQIPSQCSDTNSSPFIHQCDGIQAIQFPSVMVWDNNKHAQSAADAV